jgi:CHAT domain-containing protein
LRLLVATLLAVGLAGASSGQEVDSRAGAAAAARAFYVAFASGDEAAVTSMWAGVAPAALRRRTGWTMHTRCMRLIAFDVTDVQVNGETATVSVHALLTRRPHEGTDALEPHDATLALVQAGGRWRIAAWTLREEALVDAIVAAPSDAARQALIDAHQAAVTPLLNRLLARRALELYNNQDLPLVGSLVALMKRVAREIGDLSGVSVAFSLDSILLRIGDPALYPAALEAGRTGVALAERSGDPDALAKTLLRLGRAEEEIARETSHSERFERVLTLADEVEDPVPIASAASRLAAFHSNRGDHRRALYYGGLALDIARRSGDLLGMSAAETNIAAEYHYDGDFELAAVHFRKALAAARAAGYHAGEVSSLVSLAAGQQRLGHLAAFRRLRAEVLRILDPELDADQLTGMYQNDVLDALDRGHLAEAAHAVEMAIRTARQDGDLSMSYMLRALVHLRQRKPHEALRDVAASVAAYPAGEPSGAAVQTASALRQLGRIPEAIASLRSALADIESTRKNIVADDRQRRSFFAHRLAAYTTLVDLLVEQGEREEAFSIADETKGRALLDILSGAQSRIPPMSDEEHRIERELAARVSGRNALGTDAAAGAGLEPSRDMLDAFRAQMRAKYPSAAAGTAPVALAPAELNALLPDRKTAFVEYVLTEERMHIFVVRRGAAGPVIRVRSVTIGRRRLESAASGLVAALASGDLRYQAAAGALYRRLITPIEPDLHGVTTICLVPDGALWQLPFEALIGPRGEFLAADMATFYAPSVAVYSVMQHSRPPRRKGPPSLLAFANPPVPALAGARGAAIRSSELTPLPDAEREVSAAATWCARPAVYLGRDALETRAKRESEKYDVVHFATHGVIDDVNPMYSHLLLAAGGGDDGLLETWEMMRLDLHAELVVLSACDTARGKVDAGEGLIGMAWALFAAGCPSTIATQWKVESASAADLMTAFYRQWRGGGATGAFAKADALQRARAVIRRDPKRRHPFFWASHVLIGLGD